MANLKILNSILKILTAILKFTLRKTQVSVIGGGGVWGGGI